MKRGKKPFSVELLVDRGIFPPDWKEIIYQRGKEGGNKLDFAIELNINRKTLYRLMERSDDFRGTIEQALQYSEQWFISKAMNDWKENTGKNINSNFFKYFVSNVYRDSEWVDRTDITTDGKSITPDNQIQIEIIRKKEDEDTDNNK